MNENIIQKTYYGDAYEDIQYRGGLGYFTRRYHRALEKNLPRSDYPTVLEIGGGKGEHVPFVQHYFATYTSIDLQNNEKRTDLGTELLQKISYLTGDARKLPFEDMKFSRTIATCVLLHIPEVEKALSELRRVTEDKGQISLYLPNDPGMLYRWIRHFTSHRKQANQLNVPMEKIKYLWAKEHVNHYLGVKSLLKVIFAQDEVKTYRFPIRWFSWNMNLFTIFQITVNKKI